MTGDQGGLRWWLRQGGAAIVEQGLASLGGLTLNVLLARWLSASHYGAFAASFAIYLFVFQVHHAVFAEPALVLSSREYGERSGAYFRALLALHVVATVPIGLAIAAVSIGWRSRWPAELGEALLGVALVVPVATARELFRRLCYARFRPELAAYGAAVQLTLQAAVLALLHRAGALSLLSAYATLAATSAVVVAAWAIALGLGRSAPSGGVTVSEVLRRHWAYAGFGAAGAPLQWVTGNAFYLLLPALAPSGLAAAGQLRAIQNLVQPMLQATGALVTVLLPDLAARGVTKSRLLRAIGLLGGTALAYGFCVAVAGDALFAVLYARPFDLPRALLWVMAAAPAVASVAAVLRAGALAAGLPRAPLVGSAIAALVTLALGVPLASRFGLLGIAWATAFALTAQALVLVRALRASGVGAEPR